MKREWGRSWEGLEEEKRERKHSFIILRRRASPFPSLSSFLLSKPKTIQMASPISLISTPVHSTHIFSPEMLLEIFSHCDPRTLARVSQANLACLQLSSKLLYKDVVFKDSHKSILLEGELSF